MDDHVVLGIETSCDDTAAALVRGSRTPSTEGTILSHVLPSQRALYDRYGGVVPEVASREHLASLQDVVRKTFQEAGLTLQDISAIAVTAGPGLIGGVMVGVQFAKALALGGGKEFIAVNHLEGHALLPRLTNQVRFPYLLLLMSGGHTQFLLTRGVGNHQLLGTTLDDALGETFDKTARLLGLPYPGGAALEELATGGQKDAFQFPKTLFRRPGCDFSFSGLKTAVSRQFSRETPSKQRKADLAASFQETVAQILEDRLKNAIQMAYKLCPDLSHLVLSGGVAANRFLYNRLQAIELKLQTIAPPPALCTDNGVMIAWAGLEKLRLGHKDELDICPRSRWPLAEV